MEILLKFVLSFFLLTHSQNPELSSVFTDNSIDLLSRDSRKSFLSESKESLCGQMKSQNCLENEIEIFFGLVKRFSVRSLFLFLNCKTQLLK